MYFAGIGVAVNVVSALVLYRYFQFVGIAAATSIAAWVNATLLGSTLTARGFFKTDKRLRRNLIGILFNSLIMGALLIFINKWLGGYFTTQTGLAIRGAIMLAIVVVGAGLYFAMSHYSGVFRWRDFKSALKRSKAQ
jgi:putative peptidoglycan lipid II flippase